VVAVVRVGGLHHRYEWKHAASYLTPNGNQREYHRCVVVCKVFRLSRVMGVSSVIAAERRRSVSRLNEQDDRVTGKFARLD
jgi:hypothetical protein